MCRPREKSAHHGHHRGRPTVDPATATAASYTQHIELYRGSVSTVYRAVDEATGARVILKCYHKNKMQVRLASSPPRLHLRTQLLSIQAPQRHHRRTADARDAQARPTHNTRGRPIPSSPFSLPCPTKPVPCLVFTHRRSTTTSWTERSWQCRP